MNNKSYAVNSGVCVEGIGKLSVFAIEDTSAAISGCGVNIALG